jgi:hypothetical protein
MGRSLSYWQRKQRARNKSDAMARTARLGTVNTDSKSTLREQIKTAC